MTPRVDATAALPTKIWWVEFIDGRNLLRAVGTPSTARVLDGSHTVWEFADGFELVSRPGRASSLRVETLGLPSFPPASPELSLEPGPAVEESLERTRGEAATVTLTAAAAEIQLRGRIARLAGRLTDLSEPLDVIRRSFATDELVRPRDMDPYQFAASLLQEHLRPPALNDAFMRLDASSVTSSGQSRPLSIDLDPDKGTAAHQRLLRRLVSSCEGAGYVVSFNDEVDARIERSPRCQVLFEVKTADRQSFTRQLRLGVGQLLDYHFRFRHLADETELCLIITSPPGFGSKEGAFARAAGVAVVFARGNTLDGLGTVLSTGHSS